MKVSIVIPTFNEAEAIKPLLLRIREIYALIQKTGYDLEVIIVDDNSTDNTQGIVRAIEHNFPFPVILIARRERDLATAILEGWKYATGEIWGVMDADLSHPPEVLPELLQSIETADIVIGSRNIKGGGVEDWPIHRRLFSMAGALLARILGVKSSDPMSGFFLVRAKALAAVTLSPIGYKILLEILVKGKYERVVEVPYIFQNRSVGKSKLGYRVMSRYLRHIFRLWLWRVKHHR